MFVCGSVAVDRDGALGAGTDPGRCIALQLVERGRACEKRFESGTRDCLWLAAGRTRMPPGWRRDVEVRGSDATANAPCSHTNWTILWLSVDLELIDPPAIRSIAIAMYEPSAVQILITALIASVVVGLGLATWSWSRAKRRFAVGMAATFVAFVGWRLVLIASSGANFDVDNPVLLGLSAEDVGSGVLTFLLTALPLGLVLERAEQADRVVRTALLAGLLALAADRFL